MTRASIAAGLTPSSSAGRATELFAQYQQEIYRHTDRLFAGLMVLQWIGGIMFALWVSPLAWAGAESSTHLHVWAAVIVGGLINLPPALLGVCRSGEPSTRYTIATAQMLSGALLIHLTGGRIETHFHVFGSLAFLAFYRDWRVLVPATIVVALDHMLRGIFWPQSVYGIVAASQWRWVEHAAWVIFEDIFLVVSCQRSIAEMMQTAERTAALEQEVRVREQAESDASLSASVGLALTHSTDLRGMLDDCAAALLKHLDGTFAGIWLVRTVDGALELKTRAGVHGALRSGYVCAAADAESAIAQVARRRQPHICSAADVPSPTIDAAWPDRNRTFAGYPLVLDRKVIGVMAVFSRRQFSATTLDAMAAVADAVALGIDRKDAERDRAKYTRDLERAHEAQRQNAQQLTAVVDQLRITKSQAESATRAKSEFMASMSHELRTPLNAIILYSELLLEVAADQGQAAAVPDLQRIRSAGKHLLELINGILDLSKIEAGKMAVSIETVDARALIADVIDTVRPLVQKNRNVLDIVCAADIGTIDTDLMKARQVLLNLLGNASKFTHDGTITLGVRRVMIDGTPGIEFTVADTGVGMNDEQCSRIFEAFTQADVTTSRKYGGTGLGLALVAKFCELLGGTVSVASEPGRGSRFTVVLPFRAAAHAPADAA
jgi:signal transduction histidine kinase